MKLPMRNSLAFTLVELLVVIAILAILAAIAVPTINKTIQSSQRSQCMGNLRAIGAGMQLFVAENNMRFPPAKLDAEAFPGFSADPKWFGQFEPYIYEAVSSRKTKASVFLCPSDTRKDWYCSYAMNERPSRFDHQKGKLLIPMSTLRGDPSKLIYAADSGGNSATIKWEASKTPKGHSVEYRHMAKKKRDQKKTYASAQEYLDTGGVANFLFFDGHVESLRDEQLTEEMFSGK
jgi:prepilin-type N-terminal cleavage/methylation domain-containing protein/prepilin-type processing-associated H-X9-DG protein